MLHAAQDLIQGDRQQDYGNKLQNFSQIAMLWQGTLAMKLAPGVRITPEDVALCMMQVKIARLAKSPDHKDSTSWMWQVMLAATIFCKKNAQKVWPCLA